MSGRDGTSLASGRLGAKDLAIRLPCIAHRLLKGTLLGPTTPTTLPAIFYDYDAIAAATSIPTASMGSLKRCGCQAKPPATEYK